MNGIALILSIAASSLQAGSQADPARMAVIWDAVETRLTNQTDAWFDNGEFPRCVQTLRILSSFNPKDYETTTNLGWMLENIERWDEALRIYVQYRQDNPNDPEAAYPEAWFYYQRRAYSKVPPILEPTIKMKKRPHPNTYRTLAQAYERLGLLSDSLRVYKELKKIIPDDGATQRNIEKIEKKMKGDGGEAKGPR